MGSAFRWDWNKPRDLSREEHRNKVERIGKNADHTAGDTGRWHCGLANCVESSEQKHPCIVLWSIAQFLLTRWSQKNFFACSVQKSEMRKTKIYSFSSELFWVLGN